MILPYFGVISEVIQVFSRKPIFGYKAVAYSTAAIGFLGFLVWAHHMFTVGLPVISQSFFMLMTMLIAIPTGVKIFNWAGTLWGGHLQFKAPLLFAVGFLTMFVIGGLSGVYSAVVPVDYQLHNSYFIVAHIHYVLFGGSVFAVFAACYYWFPKISGRLYSETLGSWHFWMMIVGFNLTFFPMHILGLMGMQRRIATYPIDTGFLPWNVVETIGAFLMGFAILVFVWNMRSCRGAGGAWLATILAGQHAGVARHRRHRPNTTSSSLPAFGRSGPLGICAWRRSSDDCRAAPMPALESGSSQPTGCPGPLTGAWRSSSPHVHLPSRAAAPRAAGVLTPGLRRRSRSAARWSSAWRWSWTAPREPCRTRPGSTPLTLWSRPSLACSRCWPVSAAWLYRRR